MLWLVYWWRPLAVLYNLWNDQSYLFLLLLRWGDLYRHNGVSLLLQLLLELVSCLIVVLRDEDAISGFPMALDGSYVFLLCGFTLCSSRKSNLWHFTPWNTLWIFTVTVLMCCPYIFRCA